MSTLAIVSSTLNSETDLPKLIESLEAQTDLDFTWVVADGGSTDNTLDLLRSIKSFDVVVDTQEDFGIYDGLNRAVKLVAADYYVVAGSDDCFEPDAVANFKHAMSAQPSFIVAGIRVGSVVSWPMGGNLLVYGQRKFVSGHAVGLAIRTDMHQEYGFYSKRFPIAADQYFLQKAYLAGESFCRANFVAGSFSVAGTSGNDLLGALTESMRVSAELTGKPLRSIVIFLAKVLKYRRKLFAPKVRAKPVSET